MESEVLAAAVEAPTFDDAAQAYCEGYIHGSLILAAAVDSTAGEVREIAGQVETARGWSNGLPAGDSDWVAICIYDVHEQPGIRKDMSYISYWGIPSAQGGLTGW